MSDVFDQATEREERDREAAVERARRQAALLPYVGHCLFCGESLPEPRRFCDADCRDGHERVEKQRNIQGRR